jgi:3-dehydroquinate synthase
MVQQRFKHLAFMPSFPVQTPQRNYQAIVERGALSSLGNHIPKKAGKIFVITEWGVWNMHQGPVLQALQGRQFQVIFFSGGEVNKRLSRVEELADQVLQGGGDRSSLVIAFGGGIVCDTAGFLAAIFMRGIPVIQIPTTLLAQVDAAVGGKTGVNLAEGKNLIGSFHQPLVVIIDPSVLGTLPQREYRAGLYEIIKCGVIADARLFETMESRREQVLAHDAAIVDEIIAGAVRIKAHVVTEDEREGDLRRILNFGHTFGHALEAETKYSRFLHGEAVAWGMNAAIYLAQSAGLVEAKEGQRMLDCIASYGPIPALDGLSPAALAARLQADKKTIQGQVHFVLPETIGRVRITAGVTGEAVLAAIETALSA